jgi:restriction system protein
VLAVPALAAVSRVTRSEDRARVAEAAKGIAAVREPAVRPSGEPPAAESAADSLRRNLDHARNLAAAGSHLEALGVTSFEFRDVYRAAWVQAVASLDHWAGLEIATRTRVLLDGPADRWPPTFGRTLFRYKKELTDARAAGEAAVRRAIGKQLAQGRLTLQGPEKIRQAVEDVSAVADLWGQVGEVLVPPAGGTEVAARLDEVVQRRHRIVHRYDEDLANPPYKQDVDLASTMAAIDLVDQVTDGILLVLDQG